VWGIGKASISGKQCNTHEELSVQAQAASAAITMESVHGMAGSYSTRLCAVLVLRGQCVNGHPDVRRDLRRGIPTSERIAHAQQLRQNLQRVVERRWKCFADSLASGSPNRSP
jgi:hypothetical protein